MRGSSIELFSDYFAQASNIFTLIDARVKLIFVLAVLALVLLGDKVGVSLLIVVLCIFILLLIRIPFRVILARMAGPLAMVSVIIVLQGLFFGKTPLYSFDHAGFCISIYKEGIGKGLLMASHVMAGTSLVLFLSITTPVNKLLGALKYFRVPNGWLEIMAFTYRYIFVFIEEAQSIMDAQRLRLGYRGVANGLRSWGTLVGSLFTRVYDQANATHTAMVLRGHSGMLHIKNPDRLTMSDIGASLLMVAVFSLLLLATFYWG